MKYFIQHDIETLVQNAVFKEPEIQSPTFEIMDVKFYPTEFSHADGWTKNSWIAEGEIEAQGYMQAINKFRSKLEMVVSRISLISQAYIEFVFGSFIIKREDQEVFYARCVRERPPSPMMFTQTGLNALNQLMVNNDVPEGFYLNWLQANNSYGYIPKIQMMLSAIESLCKNDKGKTDWSKLELILGKDLKEKVWRPGEGVSAGLRHRLAHGWFLISEDQSQNYIDLLHQRVIDYFNKEILKEDLISNKVVSPQRHFWGNREEVRVFLRAAKNIQVDLLSIVEEFKLNELVTSKKYIYTQPPETY